MKREVMHRADRDIMWLQREFSIHLSNLLDTGQASRVLKLKRNSLEHLLQHYFRVTIIYRDGAFDVESLVQNLLGKLLEIKGAVEVYISYGDNHSVITIKNKLMVYGGDFGDRYHGDVDVFNKDNSIWSRLTVQGSLPGVGASHAVVSIGTKVFIIGGTEDKHYYNNVWNQTFLSVENVGNMNIPSKSCWFDNLEHNILMFEQYQHSVQTSRTGLQYLAVEQKAHGGRTHSQLLGAKVLGKVDGAFDSGFLMTTIVNRKLLREVLFSSRQGLISIELILATTLISTCHVAATQPFLNSSNLELVKASQSHTNNAYTSRTKSQS
ncbi:hypothetical protein GOBAR_AA26270 [Gossypium barbadense]|uniref:3'-5' exonuclease domain-containing protein n=1 Tax=Gossypium barbadense TaxID=3634 RepID=A0A2P5WTK4_GOSBA|nr:hypothetical protein GOBAR_AA26270 [Gossypium barbadense]